jgi:sugar lactone lactonase YvrE
MSYLSSHRIPRIGQTSSGWIVFTLIGALLVAGCDFNPDFSEFNDPVESDPDRPDACIEEGPLCTVAGVAGEAGFAGNGGPALDARFNFPIDIALPPLTLAQTGDLYVVDWQNHAIRQITPDGSVISFIGSGMPGDDTEGDAGQLRLQLPTDFTISPRGHFYVSDWQNGKVKVINPITLRAFDFYGTTPGFAGDGGPAVQAKMHLPSSFTFDPNGDMYISDQLNQRIRRIDAAGVISTYSGESVGFSDGPLDAARYHFPDGELATPGGKIHMNTHDWTLVVADTENHRVRRINVLTGEVTTIAGNGSPGYSGDGGNARSAQLNRPTDVIFREDHHIYIADSGNHVIRKVDPFGNITTVAGTGEAGNSPDGTPAMEARLNTPMGIFYDEVTFTLYIADTFNHQIKKTKDR